MNLRWTVCIAAGLGMASVASAQEQELTAGELPSNAFTIESGDIVLNPLFQASAYGLTDDLELRSILLGNFIGPNVSIKYSFIDEEAWGMSVEPHIATTWVEPGLTTGADVLYTQVFEGNDRLNLGVGANYVSRPDLDIDPEVQVPIHVGYELVPDDRSSLDLFVRTNALTAIDGDIGLNFGAHYYMGWETFRLGVGANLLTGPVVEESIREVDEQLGTNLADLSVLPVPYVATWWKF